ncbi:helix-turn-helix domain-containing protein [Paenibacillus macerans]|uniref:Helix-turn-helix domain-containing protein n=1 Tax=Paenibacillus macerans TaxID=44252 RepID=A0A6N8F192_PAEMA|nr:helix-turn-helix transcriptional regulator [Paenibacillus macerans]MUG24920.1 helix-turn-helix domain-containing protein [Paenibacillus macerans]
MSTRSLEDIIREMNELGVTPETIGQHIKDIENQLKMEVGKMFEKMTIRQARISKGMTLEDVAEETGYSVKRLEWLENNSGNLTLEEGLAFCSLYGVSPSEVDFSSGEKAEKKEMKFLFPTARKMTFTASIKAMISDIILSVTDDEQYSDWALMKDLQSLLEEISREEEILINELSEEMEKSKNHLNLSLAGR